VQYISSESFRFCCGFIIESLLLIGHAGKLVKLGMGIMNTHSKYADARMEVLALHSALNGIPPEKIQAILACNTTEEAASLLREEGISDKVFPSIMNKIDYYVTENVFIQNQNCCNINFQ
jgi:cobalt-precorrin-5B (C1)-methyltransferase